MGPSWLAPRPPSSRAPAFLAVLATTLAGCFEYSPHDLPTDSAHLDVHRRSLEALSATPARPPLRFVAVGDTQRTFDESRDFVAHVNRRDDVAFVIQLGDFSHLGLTFEFEVMNDLFRELRVPYFVVIGTHDLLGNGRAVYEEMFGPLDLAFTYARVRFVLLNTNGTEFGYALDVPDLEWLAEQLAPDGAFDQALVFSHVAPDGGDFTPALREPYAALLRDRGVPLSFHAHAHEFYVFEEEGVTFVVADSVDHRNYLVVTARPEGGFDFERVFF